VRQPAYAPKWSFRPALPQVSSQIVEYSGVKRQGAKRAAGAQAVLGKALRQRRSPTLLQSGLTTRFGIIRKWRTFAVATAYPNSSAVTPITRSWNGITMLFRLDSASILAARRAMSNVRG